MAARSSERDGDDVLTALYEATPNEFVAVRNRVVAELKQAGRAEDAARIKALKRPTASVWAVNQLARREPDAVAELLALGERVHAHERRVLRGGDAAGYLDEARQVRQRAAQLARRAEARLSASGQSPNAAVSRRIVQTLQAAALGDEEARAALAGGMLTTDLTPAASFGAATPDLTNTLAASLAAGKTKSTTKPAPAVNAGDRKQAAARERTTAGPGGRKPAAEHKATAGVHKRAAEHKAAAGAHKRAAATTGPKQPTAAAQRKQAVAARRQATAERKQAAAAARAHAVAERKRAALEAREERAAQRRAAAAARKRAAAAARELAAAERAVASQRAAVDRARDAVEDAESRLRAAKDALAAAELAAAAARRAFDDAAED